MSIDFEKNNSKNGKIIIATGGRVKNKYRKEKIRLSENKKREPRRVLSFLSIIFSLNLEEGLGVCANGAYLGSDLANYDMTAVSALPDSVAVL